jgi:hypothetical protein
MLVLLLTSMFVLAFNIQPVEARIISARADGIGDTPYVIDTNNQDRYPLVDPWTPAPTGSCGRPVLTAPVIISSESSEVGYIVGATLNAGFTIRNDGDAAIKLDKLGVGGRFNGGTGTLPNGLFPDFTFQTVTLQPGESHQYSGRLDLTEAGDYHFFVAYYIANPTEEEKTLLDPNNWNTCIDLAPGLTDNDRTWSAQAIDLPLATRASMLAKAMIGADYNWGGNGWNWSKAGWGREHGCKFIGSQEIRSGQYYYCDKTAGVIRGYGLDCSGLVYWAYNKAYVATTFAPKEGYEEIKTGTTTTGFVFPFNPIAFTNAHQQYQYNVQNMDKTTLKTDLLIGDLIFFDNPPADGWIDHVAMYVGDYSFDGETIKSIYYPPGTYDCVEAFSPALGILPCVLETKEFTWTENGIPKTKTITGLKARDSFKSLEKPFGRVQPASLSLEEAEVFEIYPKSPITLKVTDPRGFTVSENETEAPDMIYLNYDADEDGEPEDVVVVLNQVPGDYVIETIPKPDALPSDTYSLELSTNNSTIMLAQNVSISHIPPQPYIITSNGTAITPRLDPHDIGIRQLITSKTVVGQGFSLPVNMTIFNYGNFTEAFNVTFYANTTVITTFSNITVASRNTADINFAWSTISFAKGNYSISAYAWPVPGENNRADNNFTGGTAKVTIPGDINGDFTVDIYDAIILANAYNSKPGGQHWNPNADINGDNIVDIYDAIILANHYNQYYP